VNGIGELGRPRFRPIPNFMMSGLRFEKSKVSFHDFKVEQVSRVTVPQINEHEPRLNGRIPE
jgi:hypothetical protein